MYNHYRHIVLAEPKATAVTSLGATDHELASFSKPAKHSKLRELASNVAPALPFVAAILLVTGFAIAAYPLIVHDLPVFLAQSPLG
ncbi:hypothetical protein AruPA_15125 [Acidiphilium sp. PA]|uniref:hypothetical protein n=1 Tax=Acidiphilium sp. PA TaxID=2871705 RepID=UPI00224452D2|nr:hypothetical protein [Acidiphilium sp. PA]MCW8308370.1 hypothetical protein [Acidiphilium sp. PA]